MNRGVGAEANVFENCLDDKDDDNKTQEGRVPPAIRKHLYKKKSTEKGVEVLCDGSDEGAKVLSSYTHYMRGPSRGPPQTENDSLHERPFKRTAAL